MDHRPSPSTADALLAHTEWLQALARSLVVDPATADDLAQDAALVALTRPPERTAAMRAWLNRVVRSLASNARRGAGRRIAHEAAAARPEPVDAADEVAARWEVRRRVVDAVLALEQPYRTTILLRYFEGQTAEETALQLGVPLETVRTRTRRGLELLRGRLARLDDGSERRGMGALLLLARSGVEETSPAGGAASFAAGGALVATSTKWIAAAVLVAVMGIGAAWVIARSDPSSSPVTSKDPGAGETAGVRARPARAHPTAPEDPPAASGIDLDQCDRELDLHGVVLGADEKPVGGARVLVLQRKTLAAAMKSEEWWDAFVESGATTSAADGTFALRLTRGACVAMRVDAAGYALWESGSRQAGERVTVRLVPAVALDVVVKLHDDTPSVGAIVQLRPPRERGNLYRTGRTDAQGRVSFERLPRGTDISLLVLPIVGQDAVPAVHLGDGPRQTTEVKLVQGWPLRGVVVDAATGAPIAGARVCTSFGATAATTDAGGRFEVRIGDRVRPVPLEVVAEGYARNRTDVRSDVEAKIALVRVARIVGRVVDAQGVAVGGADVFAFSAWTESRTPQQSRGAVLTDADGKFSIDGLAPERMHLLRVAATGHAVLVRQLATAAEAPLTTDAGDLVLGAGHVIRGVVVDGDGKPAPDVEVRLSRPSIGPDPMEERRSSDDLGRFAFADVAAGPCSVEGPRGKTTRNFVDVVVPATGDLAPVTLTIGVDPAAAPKPAAIPVTVRLVDPEGAPVPGVRMSVDYVANGNSDYVVTGADGRATLSAEHAPASVFGYLPNQLQGRWLPIREPLRPGQRDVVITLRRGRAISGRVVDEDEAAVPGASLFAHRGTRQIASGAADPEGRFTILVPDGGPVSLQAIPRGGPGNDLSRRVAECAGVAPGRDDVVLRVLGEPASRTVDVEVVDERGAAIEGAQVETNFVGQDRSEYPLFGTTGRDGRCRIDRLPRTFVTLTVKVPDPQPGSRRAWTPCACRLGANEDSARFIVGRPKVVRGRVRFEDGSPCGGAFVVQIMYVALADCRTFSEADGTFELWVPPDAPTPFPVYANPWPPDVKRPLSGYDLVDVTDRELEIVLHSVPMR